MEQLSYLLESNQSSILDIHHRKTLHNSHLNTSSQTKCPRKNTIIQFLPGRGLKIAMIGGERQVSISLPPADITWRIKKHVKRSTLTQPRRPFSRCESKI